MQKLRAEYLPAQISIYVRVLVNGSLAGNVFACRWTQNGRQICWITQLVVHRDYRERGLAAGLLNEVRQDKDDVYGVMGSHPAACLAAAKAFGSESAQQYDLHVNRVDRSKALSARFRSILPRSMQKQS